MAAKLVEDVTSACPFNNKMFAIGMNEEGSRREGGEKRERNLQLISGRSVAGGDEHIGDGLLGEHGVQSTHLSAGVSPVL